MQTSTTSALAAFKHHSLLLLREYHFISCLTILIIGSSREDVMLVTEASNLDVSENRFEPTASCVNDIYAISNTCVAFKVEVIAEIPKHVVLCYSAESIQMS